MFAHLLTSTPLRTVAALAWAATAGQLFAADPLPPAAPVVKTVTLAELTLGSAIQVAFDADPVLRNVPIVVSVVDRGAVIGGPVASAEVMRRAEAVARAVPGVESVKNTCFVDAAPDPLLRALASQMKPGNRPTGAALPGVVVPPAAPAGFAPNAPLPPSAELVAVEPGKTVVVQHPSTLNAPVNILGAPVLPRASGAPDLPPGGLTAPGALTGTGPKPADVLAAVAAIRAADPRFAKLTAELKPGGAVLVSGSVPRAADVWDFAGAVRKVPGVTRVTLDPNTMR
ncbi:BON domain-containing protein [Gemmata sp. JC717]|uniref:BON domain-containing protein n=1 Tax=Gemmata algarum TaxID=2975278 RepID=UPI0021BB8BED|nr:BON domain-containing protein [Gemmata algarum]MDY3552749.1 BON domain-containing protein [Gemmata algarum]